MTGADTFVETCRSALSGVWEAQRDAVLAAADGIAARLAQGGVLHTFGTGHSSLLAQELFCRAGGLLSVNAILDPRVLLSGGALQSTGAERRAGLAADILAGYDVRPGDAGLVISNSGRNAAPVEMAQDMRRRGLFVVGLCSFAAAGAHPPRSDAGRLRDAVDVALDNGAPAGDAAIDVDGADGRVGALSTVLGAAILQALHVAVVERLGERRWIRVLPSANVDAVPEPWSEEDQEIARRITHL